MLMHNHMRAKYPYTRLAETLSSLMNLRQLENESLIDYTDWFKREMNTSKIQLGSSFFDTFVENMKEYTEERAEENQEMKKAAFWAWTAALFLHGLDQSIWGEIVRDYHKSCTKNNLISSENLAYDRRNETNFDEKET